MPGVTLPLTLNAAEVPVLRSAMHDIQVSVGDFYAETARTDNLDLLATRVRTTTAFIQVLNDLLTNESSVNGDYRALFEPILDPRMEIIQAFKYVRNVMQHVLHPVRPRTNALIGGLHGLRVYLLWEDVPPAAGSALRPRTQALRPHFDQLLRGREVTSTFLEAAWAFASVSPELVHKTAGEWTGFPLLEQPGVPAPRHPDPTYDPARTGGEH